MGRNTCRLRTKIATMMENMKEKIAFILKYYLILVFCFVLFRLIFVAVNATDEYTFADYADVAMYGLPLDIAVAGYFTALPLLLAIIAVFVYMPMRKLLLVYNVFIAVVTASAFVADISLYPFWEFKLDASILIYIDSPSNAFASVDVGYIVSRLLLAVFSATLVFLLLHKATTKTLRPSKRPLPAIFSLILAGGLIFLGIRGGIGESTNNIGKVYYSDRQFLNHSAVNPIFSFIYSLGKSDDFGEAYNFYGEEELAEIVSSLYPHDNSITDTLLNCSRPNIITIILEGMGSNLIASLGGKEGITPNYDSLVEQGVVFTNCYANSYRTDRGLICTLSGYASFPKTSVMKSPVKSRNLSSLAASLKKVGYHNTFLYGGDINFTNMKSYLYSTGYSDLIADKDFTLKQQETHQWGVTDHITFDSLLVLAQNRPQQPWHITYLTLSSHEPWTVPYNRIENDKVANSFAYTDSCLGNFISRIKNSDIWDNTLVVCIPDHALRNYPPRQKDDEKVRNKIPILLLGGALRKSGKIDVICNQSDLPATLLAQLAIPADDFPFSRNVLSPSYISPFAYHSYNNGISLVDTTGFTLFDLDSYSILTESPIDGDNLRLKKAKAILQHTYNHYQKQ